MSTLRRALALIALAGLSACGGGGSGPATPPVAGGTKAAGQVADATAQITFKFPTTFAIAKRRGAASSRTASTRRSPSYINPTGGDNIQVLINGTLVINPATSNNNFGLGTQNPDGSSTISVPISSGTYGAGSIQIDEYDGQGTLVAQGSNGPYQNQNGTENNGVLTVTPGSLNGLVVIMNMNAQYIILTTDPISGSDATAITSFEQCFAATPSAPIYAFAGDDDLGYVLPGTTSGYGGGDPFTSAYPGIPPVTLEEQSVTTIGGTSELAALAFGWKFLYDGTYGINAQFTFTNPLFGNSVSQIAQISGSGCG